MSDDGWYATADEAIAHASISIESIDGFVIYSDSVDDEGPVASAAPELAEIERPMTRD